jgi:opine dehydrogenase
MTTDRPVVAVLGAGNGGCALTADLAIRGFDVRLFNRSPERLAPIRQRGGITATGDVEGFGEPTLITTDIAAAIDGCDTIVITAPTTSLPSFAAMLVHDLKSHQLVWLNPGHMGGALCFVAELRRLGAGAVPAVCESATLSHGSRMREPAAVHVMRLVRNLLVAGVPSTSTPDCVSRLDTLLPGRVAAASSVFETGLLDLNAVEHPAQILCNAGWLEHTRGDYLFYYEGTTPAVGRVIDAVDRERMALAEAMGVPTLSFVDYFHRAGFTSAQAARTGSSYRAMQDSEPNRWIKGPPSLDHRYVHEDVGWGLVPWQALGGVFDVPMPVTASLITIATAMNGIDYPSQGLTLEKMGLADLSARSLREYVHTGVRNQPQEG